jgi:tetratricopeptide (TPR) repeat protein
VEERMELNNVNTTNQGPVFFHISYDYCIKGTLMADEGKLEEALENFNKAIETDPNNHIAFYNRATIRIDLGDIEGARNDFRIFDLIRSKLLRK